jgi:hypothetical protein
VYYFILASRAALAGVLLMAACGKLRRAAAREFAGSVAAMAFVPTALAGPITVAVLVTELATSALLLTPHTAVLGLVLATALLVGFTAALVDMRRRGVGCRCFGTAPTAPVGRAELWRNGLLLGLAAATLVAATRVAPPATPTSSDGVWMIVAVSSGLAVSMLLLPLAEGATVLARPARPYRTRASHGRPAPIGGKS